MAYNQIYSIDEYLYQEDLPAINEATICFWFGGINSSLPDDFLSVYKGLVSLAVPGETKYLI